MYKMIYDNEYGCDNYHFVKDSVDVNNFNEFYFSNFIGECLFTAAAHQKRYHVFVTESHSSVDALIEKSLHLNKPLSEHEKTYFAIKYGNLPYLPSHIVEKEYVSL